MTGSISPATASAPTSSTDDEFPVAVADAAAADTLAVSIAVCTRDRPAQLARMLESACALRVPAGLDWELLVIDNAPSASAAAIVEAFADRLPLRLVHSPSAGLSAARQRAAAEARGRYVCWTDDDVLLDGDWLQAYVDSFERHPEAALFGGSILPRLEQPVRRWCAALADRWPLTSVYAARDAGAERPIANETRTAPCGANFAVRADALRRHGFDPGLGARPALSLIGEEADFIFRLLRGGACGWWVPAARVHHIIGPDRQTRRYIWDYFVRLGATAAYLRQRSPGDNCLETGQPADFAKMGGVMIRSRMVAHALLALACGVLRLHWHSLRSLAAAGFYAGIVGHRRAARLGGFEI